MSKNPSAEELHKLIMRKRVCYEQIRKIDPEKFHDLETTMKMLYDHGPLGALENGESEPVFPVTNASLREPQPSERRRRQPERAGSPPTNTGVELGKRGTHTRPEIGLSKKNKEMPI